MNIADGKVTVDFQVLVNLMVEVYWKEHVLLNLSQLRSLNELHSVLDSSEFHHVAFADLVVL